MSICLFAFSSDEPRERHLLYDQPVAAALVAAALAQLLVAVRDAGQFRIMARMSVGGALVLRLADGSVVDYWIG